MLISARGVLQSQAGLNLGFNLPKLGISNFIMRLPVIIFLVLISSSFIVGIVVVNYGIANHLADKDHFRLETSYLTVDFPRNWFSVKWEIKNATYGNIFTAIFSPPYSPVVTVFRVLDELATDAYYQENGFNQFTDMETIVIREHNRLYEWSLLNGQNISRAFIENGTITVSNCIGRYSIMTIENGLVEEDFTYNLTSTFISCKKNSKIFQITFYGEENNWEQNNEIFMDMIETTLVEV
jgi:hypothetical protein